MICYQDRTFCASDCVNEECPRYLSPEIEAEASAYELPLALADFSENCEDYEEGK